MIELSWWTDLVSWVKRTWWLQRWLAHNTSKMKDFCGLQLDHSKPKVLFLDIYQDQKYNPGQICKENKKGADLGPIYTRQDVVRKWTSCDFLCAVGKSKFIVEYFLMGILSRSWIFCIRTWTRNAKPTRLIVFISFKVWHRHAPRNTTRNATSFWISRYTQNIASGSYQGD